MLKPQRMRLRPLGLLPATLPVLGAVDLVVAFAVVSAIFAVEDSAPAMPPRRGRERCRVDSGRMA